MRCVELQPFVAGHRELERELGQLVAAIGDRDHEACASLLVAFSEGLSEHFLFEHLTTTELCIRVDDPAAEPTVHVSSDELRQAGVG